MEYIFIVATAVVAMIVLRFTKEKEIMRISWNKLAEFVAFLVMLFVFRLMMYEFEADIGTMKQFPILPPEISQSKWTLGLVFWEDMFFGVPLYFIWKYMKNKWVQIALTVVISALFGLGHLYQGWFAVALLSIYPYFISYHYGKKHGFGTVMCGHILYDVSTVYLIQMLPYLM